MLDMNKSKPRVDAAVSLPGYGVIRFTCDWIHHYDPGCYRTKNGDGWPASSEFDFSDFQVEHSEKSRIITLIEEKLAEDNEFYSELCLLAEGLLTDALYGDDAIYENEEHQ